jgi:hypothetical protein
VTTKVPGSVWGQTDVDALAVRASVSHQLDSSLVHAAGPIEDG